MAANKFAGKCAVCGATVPAQAGTITKTPAGWAVSHNTGGCVPGAVASVVEELFDPTPEQVEIIAAAVARLTLCIEAFAGAGKTATLRLIAKALAHLTIGYTAFNAAIVRDGQGKFGSNVATHTFHKMAKDSLPGALASQFMARVNTPRMNAGVLASHLGCEPVTYKTKAGTYEVPRTRMAEWAGLTVSRWLTSASDTVESSHVFKADGIEEVLDGDSEVPSNWYDLRARLVGYARKMVADMANPKTSTLMTKQYAHGCYLKAFAMSGSALPYDVLMVDEAQDLDPVMLRIIENSAKAGVQIILVGDSNQAIYEWRGAVNALATFAATGAQTLRLTQSFRFGPEVAAVAQIMLDALGCPARIIGAGKPGTVGPIADPDAVLCRTNSAVIRYALDSLKDGKKVGVVGGVNDIVRFAEACQDLKAGRRTNHADLQAFETWAQVQDYAGSDAGADLKLLVDLIDSVGAEVVLADLARCGDHLTPGIDVVVGTTHKTKGLEWKRVALGADWKTWDADNEYSQSDLRVLYVACTRAKVALDTAAVFAKRG